ncbi:MAG: CBS domain-containing protein [Promethearchaeota archaeon]
MTNALYKGARVTYGDISEEKAFIADPETSIKDIAKIMVEHWIDSVFIVNKEEKVIGIITDGVLLMHIAKGTEFEHLKAKDIMATPVYSVKENDPISPYNKLVETFSKKHNRVKRLAILDDDDKIVGVLNMNFLKKIGRFSRSFEITLKKKQGDRDGNQ